MKRINKKLIKYIFLLVIILLITILYIYFRTVREIVSVILISFILAYSLKPAYNSLILKSNLNRRIIAATLVIIVIGFFVVSFLLLIPPLFRESLNIENIMNSLEEAIQQILSKTDLKEIRIFQTLKEQFNEKLNIMVMSFSDRSLDYLIAFSENLVSLAIIPVVTYYFLADGPMIGSKIMLLFPVSKRTLIKSISSDIDKVLGKYILSQFILCIIIGVLSFISLIILKVQFPMLLSIFNGIINIIPYFGPIFGAIPAIMIALIDSPIKAVYTAVVFFVIQQVEGNILSPQITASTISMHPLTIIILLLIGEKIGGFIGMILAIPLGVVIKVLWEDIDYHLF